VTSPLPAPRRNRVLVTIDIAAALLLQVFSIVVALVVITQALAYSGLHSLCGAGAFEGMTCNGLVLSIVVYGLIAVAVLATFIAFGMVIVGLIRKRSVFYWPLAAIVLTIVLFYIGTWVAGMTLP
jgi:hypothetical protein